MGSITLKLQNNALDVEAQICASFQKICTLLFVGIDFLDDFRDLLDGSLRGYEAGKNIAERGGTRNFVCVNMAGAQRERQLALTVDVPDVVGISIVDSDVSDAIKRGVGNAYLLRSGH